MNKNKINMWIYGLVMVANLVNAFFSYNHNNLDAVLGWLVATGMAAGCLGAYMELKQLKEDKEDDE